MEYFGAGLAALGVIGPGIGIGLLGGLSAQAIGRNPDAAGQIRGIAIILAAFAEGLGVLAIVVGLLAIFIQPASRSGRETRSWISSPSRPSVGPRGRPADRGGGEAALFQVNLFWVIVSALNFIVFFVLIWTFAFKPVSRMLEDRRERIEQGLKDAEQARQDRENAEAERVATLAEARKEANDILARAQKVAQETRDADIAATRAELERMRERATGDIEAEKQRAIAELRGEVADLALAAASRVVGEIDDGRPAAPPRPGVPGLVRRSRDAKN